MEGDEGDLGQRPSLQTPGFQTFLLLLKAMDLSPNEVVQ